MGVSATFFMGRRFALDEPYTPTPTGGRWARQRVDTPSWCGEDGGGGENGVGWEPMHEQDGMGVFVFLDCCSVVSVKSAVNSAVVIYRSCFLGTGLS